MTTSSSVNPDLDWSQVRETVRLLNLAVAQTEMSMKEGDESVDTLTDAFTTMVARVQVIEKMAKSEEEIDTKQIIEQCEAVSDEMHHVIQAFQFYDKLSQRLSHVSHSLDALGNLVSDSGRLYNPTEWSILQEKIISKYSMPAEHHMFEMVMQGKSVDEILKHVVPEVKSKDDDVELF
ncbi:hypothetical protein A9Q78_09995 [Methylophaga sp. 41_12_T18]|nr:hypothetical protein A9Q78_09995 [Methylophaga sp. 41_12_T18]